ncbi:Hypothetical protein CINCED_3A025700 [Cinara cedri]|uniref:Gustatory receptor n=1 Tax=Cinara cedri TaxID=506608 RepID=A0A5E4MI77_9HEMI|nr:Hypothetical protein CINCED_3A025700 [Cinara cedri]
MAVISAAVSANNSRRFPGLSEKFAKFDRAAASRSRRPSDDPPRTFYLFTALFVGVYNLAYGAFAHRDVAFYALLMWTALYVSTMVPVVQYAAYVRMLRERYALANGIFANSVLKNSSSSDIRYTMMYPKEVNNLFNELRDLTEEVKTYYAYHAIIIIVESVLILVSNATTLTVDCLNELDKTIVRNCYCVGHCALRLLFLFYVVREAHKAVLEVSIM